MKKALKITASIFQWLIVAALVIVLLFNVVSLIAKATTGDSMPSVFGLSNAIVRSGSMSGTIEVYDMVIVKAEDAYSIGDVITFKSGSSYVTHRIIGIDETSGEFITKGDANNTRDAGTVAVGSIKGKVARVIPSVGKVVDFLKSPAGIAVLVLVLLLLIAAPKLVECVTSGSKKSKSHKDASQPKSDNSEKIVSQNK